MLYVTTRNNVDAFTAQKVLRDNRGADGGLYMPFHMPRFSREEIDSLADKTFGQTVADVLNLLFGTRLSGWDVEFAVGRFPVRMEPLRHRIAVAETWHNPDWSYDRLVRNLVLRLGQDVQMSGNWTRIAVRIAVLFGIFGELKRSGVESADISVVSGDFSTPASVLYARQWGLPIGNLICCCNENSGLWDLIYHGQMRTDLVSVSTPIPEADVTLPEDLERLICQCGGIVEVRRYREACQLGKAYCPKDAVLAKMRKGLFVSVISSGRVNDTIPGVYGTSRYVMSPHTALAYAGLLDYRSKTGETGHAIVLSEKSPMDSCAAVAKALNVPEEEIGRIYG